MVTPIGYNAGQIDPRLASAAEAVTQAKQERQISMLRFPDDLGDVYMLLNFYDYDYARASSGSTTAEQIKASIALPLPTSLVDSSRLEVGGKQIGVLGGLAADAASGQFNVGTIGSSIAQAAGNVSGIGEALGSSLMQGDFSNMLNTVGGALTGIGNASLYLLRAGVGAIAPQVDQGIGAALGTAVNPQATLVFDGVDLKIHNFEWLFAPKSVVEQSSLDRIIQTVKHYIHPEYANPLGTDTVGIASVERGLLKYPALVEISLIGVGGTFNLMFKPDKLMMINQFNVDYTPTGNVELNRGGTPVMTRCTMNLTESTIHTKKDYPLLGPQGLTASGGEDTAEASRAASGEGDTVEGSQSTAPTASSRTAEEDQDSIDNGNRLVIPPGQLVA